MLSVTVLTLWVAPPELFCNWYRINGAETNCRIAHILGILLMNSCNTDIFFSNYYHLQSVRFEYISLQILKFLNGCILFNIGPINTKLKEFVKLGVLFLNIWVLCC